MTTKVLIATKKPFAPAAREQTVGILNEAGYDVEVLEAYSDRAELMEAVKTANAIIVRSDRIDGEVMDAAPELKLVVRAGAGYDNIDCAAASERSVTVMNTPGQNANAVAELAVGMMIMAARGQYSGKPGTELKGKTLGLHGFGNVARQLARIAGKGLEMRLLVYDPYLASEKIKESGAQPVDSPAELYSAGDYISLHIPANDETVGSINYELLSKMKDTAVLLNTARAEVIDESALLRTYREKPGFIYLSDIAPDNREEILVCDTDRCFFTPKKMGAQTEEANINAGAAAARQIVAFFERGETPNKVN